MRKFGFIKSLLTVALLLGVTTAQAQFIFVNNDQQSPIFTPDGGAHTYTSTKGTVSGTVAFSNSQCTLTITPAQGYFISKDYISVELTQPNSQTVTNLPVSGNDIAVGPAAKTYTFTIPNGTSEPYINVLVDFQATIDIGRAEITLSQSTYTYDGTEKKPAVSSVKLNGNELNANYYTVGYSNNINVGTATVTVTGNGIYKNSASTTFTINRASASAAGIAYSASSASATLGKAFNAPTLSNPHNLPVTYSSSNTSVATINSDGAVTIKGVGEATIKASFAGNNTYEAAEASYKLTVSKAADSGLAFSASEASATMGKGFTPPTLKNPNNLPVTYSSSKTNVATVDDKGNITLVGAGQTTIKAKFAGNNTYDAAEASYVLTVSKNKEHGLAFSETTALATLDEDFTPPTLANPNQLPVTYSSSDTNVATVDDEGHITLVSAGVTTISANFAGNTIYEKASVSYELTVKKNYGLWIGDTQVNSLNQHDVLENKGLFFFDPDQNLLVITNNKKSLTVESRLPELTIFLNGYSTLERIFFGDASTQGTLRIISYANIPGELTLLSQHADGVISGFSSVEIDPNSLTYLLKPENGRYENGHLRRPEGTVAGAAIIGQYIKPLVDGKQVSFSVKDFTSGDQDVDLTNKTIKNILFTLNQSYADPDENDGYDSDDQSVVLMSTVSTTDAQKVADDVAAGKYIPGSTDFAKNLVGAITFMVPDGEGTIEIDLQNEEGYIFYVMIGNSIPQKVSQTERGIIKIPYQSDHAEYIYLFMAKASGTRIGKREKVHGKVYSIKVQPSRSSNNPLGNVAGFPEAPTPEVVTSTPDPDPQAIHEIEVDPPQTRDDDHQWYDLQGRRIEKPTKAGIYIFNRKKVLVR